MNDQELIQLPLVFLKPWIETQDYKQTKYYLLLFFDFVETQKNGWYLDELAKILRHQKKVVEELLPHWLEMGWIQQHKQNNEPYYSLTPISKGEVLLIPNHLYQNLKNEIRLIDVARWLWLQLYPVSQISELALTESFQLERLTGVYRVLKVLEMAQLLWFDRELTEEGFQYELDYFTCQQKEAVDLLPISWNQEQRVSPQILEIPLQMKEWLKTSESLMISKLYCEWLMYLTTHTNYSFSLNELIKNVFSIQHYNSLHCPLKEMVNKGMIEHTQQGTRRFILNEANLSETQAIDFQLIKKALSELGYREFALWLNLQIEPTQWITTHDVLLRLNCKNKNQARNILKRLNKSGWIKLSNPSSKKREILSLTPLKAEK